MVSLFRITTPQRKMCFQRKPFRDRNFYPYWRRNTFAMLARYPVRWFAKSRKNKLNQKEAMTQQAFQVSDFETPSGENETKLWK